MNTKVIDQSVKHEEAPFFPFSGTLDKEDLIYLEALVEWQNADAGECLWRVGDMNERLGMVAQGRVKLLKKMEMKGHPIVVGLFGPGSLLMDFAVEKGLPRETSAYSIEPSQIAFLSRLQLEKVLSERPALGHRLYATALASLSEQLKHAYKRLAVFF